jgi:E1A/CREB-binding protein
MEKAPVTTNSTLGKQIQEDFCQREMSQDGTQQPFSSD